MATQSALSNPVSQLMSTHVVTLHAGASIHEALQTMVDNRVSALPIVDNEGHCVGIISTSDLLQLTYDIDDDIIRTDPLDPGSLRRLVSKLSDSVGDESVSTYMSEDVVTARDSISLRAAARIMLKDQIHHLPIVNERDELIGILSSMDILAEIADEP